MRPGTRQRTNRLRIAAVGLAWLAAILACNFPARVLPRGPASYMDFAQTLTAQASPYAPLATGLPGQPAPTQAPPLATAAPIPATPEPGQPAPTQVLPLQPPVYGEPGDVYTYVTQSGDTLVALALRFGVELGAISALTPLPASGLLPAGLSLSIPNVLEDTLPIAGWFPDSEVVYSPSAGAFDLGTFIQQSGGYLAGYQEQVDEELLSGTEIVRRVAVEISVHPRLLLAVLEYRSGWVFGQPESEDERLYPIGFYVPDYSGLYKELSLTAKQLNIGYYGWRSGEKTGLEFGDGQPGRLDPRLNPGSVAVHYLFATLHKRPSWEAVMFGDNNFFKYYEAMFGNPWAQARPIFPEGLAAPALELPFAPGEQWAFTAGPHIAWTTGTAQGAIDFSPVTGEPACAVSRVWVTASASGMVVRSERGAVVLDLDGDGREATGWTVLYMHVAEQDRAALSAWVNTDAPLGHPSCEGGRATGTNLHLARKYNGEWLPTGEPFPLVLSGWQVQAGERPYEGFLVKGEQVVTARPDGSHGTTIIR